MSDAIIAAVAALERQARVRRTDLGAGFEYRVEGSRYRLYVAVRPGQFLAAELAVDVVGGRSLSYSVDTDNYDISLAKYRAFATDIEAAIVDLIDAVAAGRVLVGVRKGRPTLVVPTGADAVRVTGRFVVSTVGRASVADAMDGGQFEPLT